MATTVGFFSSAAQAAEPFLADLAHITAIVAALISIYFYIRKKK